MVVADRYTRTAITLHWLIAVLMIGNVTLILFVDTFPDAMVRPAINLHKSIGLTVLGLGLLRVLWRLSHRPPPLPPGMPVWERLGAHAAHLVLYGLILGLPISGWVHDSAFKSAGDFPLYLYGVIPWFRIGPIMALDPATKEQVHTLWFQIHSSLAYVLYAMVALHILGALKHQFIDKQPELQRMLPGRK
ncbi:cytochrome b [Acidisphaera sp. L21]|uniref:cytochrome b n=1 Tax=Acidisphaera sp. L21 TaxID=1641851 RepID=UPI00131DC335|nr:cytochrome b/b6 domain-containing protein [Acidisphaera sp. L21]